MALEFYGIEQARNDGWVLMQDPAPVDCRLAEREAYEKRLDTIRRMGAVIVGFRPSFNARAWVFGLPPGEIDLRRMKAMAEKAGMLLPADHPDFTYRWKGRECRDIAELLAFRGDVMAYHLQQLCKVDTNIMARRKAIAAEIAVWRKHRANYEDGKPR